MTDLREKKEIYGRFNLCWEFMFGKSSNSGDANRVGRLFIENLQ